MPGAVPVPTRLFHMTAASNLPSILRSGQLLATNYLARRGIQPASIAYANIQATRAALQVPCGPGRVIHDYVPFHFAPRSPMLYAIHGGNIQGYQGGQSGIVYFEGHAQALAGFNLPFVFYDMHPVVALAQAFDNLADLGNVAWDLLTEHPHLDGFCRYWQNDVRSARHVRRRELRQAEFLVHHCVPLTCLHRIGVYDARMQSQVSELAQLHGVALSVDICAGWYY